MSTFLDAVDWQRPWLTHLLAVSRPVVQAADWRTAINRIAAEKAIINHRNIPLHFVQQDELPAGIAYETFISDTGGVPTRTNLHDLFNALAWLTFPKIKAGLNALQAAEIERHQRSQEISGGTHPARGRVRDAATIFDENAAFIVTGNIALVDALRSHQWQEAFLTRRDWFDSTAEICLFGHALVEKLVTPYKSITAHARLVLVDDRYFSLAAEQKLAWIDATVAEQLKVSLAASDFTPLPVLGVPGWWGGQDRAFYADATVFRPPKLAKI